MRFDRVITNPPFSQNYERAGMHFPERFRHGFCPEGGKKADLMFLQHMLAVLKPGGVMATVMPHGVLFRGGAEKEIRASILQEDLLEAVIGLAPNLFYGASIPACILVLRAPAPYGAPAKPPERRGKVLFINADAEYHAGRAQNYLWPEHVEKIVSTFEAFREVEGYSRVVGLEELAENDYNLNIRRYADNAPPPEPHDVRAHLLGGVPWAEVEAKRELFEAVRLDPAAIFVPRSGDADASIRRQTKDKAPALGQQLPLSLDLGASPYVDFRPEITERRRIKERIEAEPGVLAQQARLHDAFDAWWAEHEPRLAALPGSNNLFEVRADLLDSFVAALLPVGMLDRFQVAGAVASWWDAIQYDLKTLAAQGFYGLVDSWIASLRAVLEDGATRGSEDPLEHPLVQRVLPGYLDRLETVEAAVADLKSQIAEAEREPEEDEEEAEETLSQEQIRKLKRDLTGQRKRLKALQGELLDRLEAARLKLVLEEAEALVMEIERKRLERELERYAAAQRQKAVTAVENLWDKYSISLREIEAQRDDALEQMSAFSRVLGYV
jgi:type I restriction enzyme M protein